MRWLRDAGVRLTTREEAATIRDRAETRAAWVDEDDLTSLGFSEFLESLTTGVAAHHAGMLPLFKETVEELFQEGLVKVVFATETLSLGINMPAKSVVIEDLWKFQGERHELVTPGEYTQLTGRAGRRGIDALGHAVVVYQRQVPFERVAGLAATRTYDLASSFRPSYNMAVNLVRNYTPEQSHHLLNSSFAQFLADRGVVVLERSRQQDLATLEGYRKNMTCHLGDFEEYWGYLEKARRLREDDRQARDQGRRDDVRAGVAGLRPGDVVWVPRARRRGLAVVVSSRDGKPTVLAQDRQFFRLTPRDFEDPPQVLTKIPLPRSGSVRNPRFRRDVAARLVALDVKTGGGKRRGQTSPKVEREAARLEALAEAHPCRRCPERAKHERWAARAAELQRRLGGVERRIRVRTETLARQFDRVLSVLRALGYVEEWELTHEGADAHAHLRRGRPPGGRGARVRAPRRPAPLRGRRAPVGGDLRGTRAHPAVGRDADRRDEGAVRAAPATVAEGPPHRRTSTRCSSAASWRRGSPGRSTGGPRATPSTTSSRRPRWPPETSSATASSSWTCSARSRTSRPPRPRRRSGRARGSILRGVVAYTGV